MPDTELNVEGIEECVEAYKEGVVKLLEHYDCLEESDRAAVRLLLKHQPKCKPRMAKAATK